MTRRRPPSIPERRPVFIGCEGASEAAYASLLQDMLRDEGLPVHLVVHDLGRGAGDPLARTRRAVQKLDHLRRTRFAPRQRFILLDADQAVRDPQGAAAARTLATANKITIVWQEPCFEAVLLRHLPGQATQQPPDTAAAIRALARAWPAYGKPMSGRDLAGRIDRQAISRASQVEPDLCRLLQCLGLER